MTMANRLRASIESPQSPPLQYDSGVVVHQLSKDLYPSPIAALWELIRNSFIAGMPEGSERWVAEKAAHVEIVVREERGVRFCYLFDAGVGLTRYNVDRMTHAGGNEKSAERAGGASKRQIGRLAGLALNSAFDHALAEISGSEGMTYYSRTVEDIRSGRDAASLAINMDCIRDGKAFTYMPNHVSMRDQRLGPFVGRSGSFTLLVIPNFKMSAEEIRRELPYYLPRKADRQTCVRVNDEPVLGNIVDARRSYISENGEFEIYLGLKDPNSPVRHVAEGDIVICDAVSACAVATIRESSTDALYHYLRDGRLCGVVFYPDIFGKTDTSRRSLFSDFWKTREGRKLAHYLNSTRTKELVSGVLGTDIEPDNNKRKEDLGAVLRLLGDAFGPPIHTSPSKTDEKSGGKPPTDKNPERDGKKGGTDKPQENPRKERGQFERQQALVLPIGNREYVLRVEYNDRSPIAASQPPDPNERSVVFGEKTFNVIRVNPEWKGSRDVTPTQRANFMVSEILRVAAEFAGYSPRQRDELRTQYYVDVCKGTWKSQQT